MQKEIFEKLKGVEVKVVLKPKGFVLDGIIDAVFEDCFEFTTKQKTSYIDFESVMNVTKKHGGDS